MKTVNPYFLHTLLAPYSGLADVDEEVIRFRSFDINDEAASRTLIRENIVPYARNLNQATLLKVRDAYRYYLSKSDSDWDRVFFSLLLPFNPPNNVRHFFLWIYEEVFNEKDYFVRDSDSWVVQADIHEPLE